MAKTIQEDNGCDGGNLKSGILPLNKLKTTISTEENSEFKEKLVAFNGEEEFLKTIKHKKLKQVMTKTWKKNKHYWV